MDSISMLAADALKALGPAAIKMMGGSKASQALTAGKLASLSSEARAAFCGADLQAVLVQGGLSKVRALVCATGSCPGAVIDWTINHEGVLSDADLLAFITSAAEKVGLSTDGIRLQQAATLYRASSSRRRLGTASRGLGYNGAVNANADTETVVRAVASTKADAASLDSAVASSLVRTPLAGVSMATTTLTVGNAPPVIDGGVHGGGDGDGGTGTAGAGTGGGSIVVIGAAVGGVGFLLIIIIIIIVVVVVKNKNRAGAQGRNLPGLPAVQVAPRQVEMNNIPIAIPTATEVGRVDMGGVGSRYGTGVELQTVPSRHDSADINDVSIVWKRNPSLGCVRDAGVRP